MDKLKLPEKNTEDAATSDKNQKARRFSLMDDMVSKFVFNDPADPWTPLGFLQAMRPEYPMSDIQLHSGEMIARFPADKTIRYDVHGIINNTLLFDMEFQRYGNARDQERRIAYYLTRLFNAQELRGKSFDQLKPAWLILVADWPDDDVPFEQSLTNMLHLSILNVGRCFLFNIKCAVIQIVILFFCIYYLKRYAIHKKINVTVIIPTAFMSIVRLPLIKPL